MKKYEELFYTIKSMDGPEVRYFKLFAKRHVIGNENTYTKLFEAIKKQATSDDNELRSIFKKEVFAKNLPSAKLYLLRLINKSLYHYHDNEDALSIVLRNIKLAEIYYSKAYYELAETHLKKARNLAEKKELFVFSLLISELRLKNSISSSEENDFKKSIQDEMLYEKAIFNKYLNLREYQHAYARYKALEKIIFIPASSSEKKQYDLLLSNVLFKSPENALSDKAKGIFYELKNSYEDKRFDKITKDEMNEELLDFFIEHPQLFRKNTSTFIQAVHDYLIDCLNTGDLTKFRSGLKKFKLLKTSSQILNAQIIFRAAGIELTQAQTSGDYSKSTEIISEAENKLSNYDKSVGLPLIMNLYHIQCANFYLKANYKSALRWNIKILNDSRLRSSSEIKRKSNITNLIIHLKLNNFDLLENLIAAEKRKYRSEPLKYQFENFISSVLKKIIYSTGNRTISRIQKQFNMRLLDLKSAKTFQSYGKDPLLKEAFSSGKNSIFFNR